MIIPISKLFSDKSQKQFCPSKVLGSFSPGKVLGVFCPGITARLNDMSPARAGSDGGRPACRSGRQPRFGFFPPSHQAFCQPDAFWRGRVKSKNQTGFSIISALTHHDEGDTIRNLTRKMLKGAIMDNNQERRKYKRYEKTPIEDRFIVRLQIKSDETHAMKSDNWDSVTLINISAGGIFFLSKKDLGIGSLFDLKIDIVHSSHTIDCVGEIIRIEIPTSPSVFAIAIEFIGLDEQEKEMINTTIEDFLE